MPKTYDTRGRERYDAVMKSAGYVEYRAFEGYESYRGYWCKSCPAMNRSDSSITGYWCQKFGFPDRPHGCCNGWFAFPEIEELQK